MTPLLAKFSCAFEAILAPVADALRDTSGTSLALLLENLGWDPLDSPDQVGAIAAALALDDLFSAADDIATRLRNGDDNVVALVGDLEKTLSAIVKQLTALSSAPPSDLPAPLEANSSFWASLPADLLDYLLLSYLEREHPIFFGLLLLTGLAEVVPETPAGPGRIPYLRYALHWERLGSAVTDPSGEFQRCFHWNTPGLPFDHGRLVAVLARIANGLGIVSRVLPPAASLAARYYPSESPDASPVHQLEVPFISGDPNAGGGHIDLGLVVLPIPSSPASVPSGILFTTLARGYTEEGVPLGGDWTLLLEGGFEVDGAVGFEVFPGKVGVALSAPSLNARIAVTHSPADPLILLGSAGGSRLELGEIDASLHAQGLAPAPEIVAELGTAQASQQGTASLVIVPAEGDAFVQKALGPDPIRITFAGRLTWSSVHGLGLDGSASLSADLAVHSSLAGIVRLDVVRVAIASGSAPGSASLMVAVTGGVDLGPVHVVVDQVGLRLTAVPDSSGQGSLGRLDLRAGFKPPSGLGIAIDASTVTGGGYLWSDEAAQEYRGVLDLDLAERVSVKAIGVLTTAPGHYSFAGLIFVEDFTPIELGMGFSLTGVGGLVAINRAAAVDVLRAGLRTHLLDDLLFPADPIAQAPHIISSLEQAFPFTDGRYLFGPMVQISWGEPVIVTAELAVLLELPAPIRVILLGRLDALLPKPKAAIVELHMDVLGVIDFGAESLALDASLHDSRVAAFAVAGDMALRLVWGGPERRFLLAIGGFNPRFQPPPSFPKLARVSISLSQSDNPRLRLEAYFAVTSNTVQVGAHLELHAAAGSFALDGLLAFDALIQLEPFMFIVDIHAGVALLFDGSPLAALTLDGTLSGPSPWHARGQATFSVLFFSISVGFDVTIGESAPAPPLPPPPVHERLVAALAEPKNWSATLGATSPLVTLRKIEETGSILAHPLAQLAVHQQIVPLDVEVTRFGATPLPNPHTFSVRSGSVLLNGTAPAAGTEAVKDYFASAQFRDLSDDQKLSAPSFEPFDAGFRVVLDEVRSGPAQRRDIVYQEVVVDPLAGPPTRAPRPLEPGDFHATPIPRGGGRLRTTGRLRFRGPDRSLPVRSTRYLVATGDTMRPALGETPDEAASYSEAQDRLHAAQREAGNGPAGLQVVGAHEVNL